MDSNDPLERGNMPDDGQRLALRTELEYIKASIQRVESTLKEHCSREDQVRDRVLSLEHELRGVKDQLGTLIRNPIIYAAVGGGGVVAVLTELARYLLQIARAGP